MDLKLGFLNQTLIFLVITDGVDSQGWKHGEALGFGGWKVCCEGWRGGEIGTTPTFTAHCVPLTCNLLYSRSSTWHSALETQRGKRLDQVLAVTIVKDKTEVLKHVCVLQRWLWCLLGRWQYKLGRARITYSERVNPNSLICRKETIAPAVHGDEIK